MWNRACTRAARSHRTRCKFSRGRVAVKPKPIFIRSFARRISSGFVWNLSRMISRRWNGVKTILMLAVVYGGFFFRACTDARDSGVVVGVYVQCSSSGEAHVNIRVLSISTRSAGTAYRLYVYRTRDGDVLLDVILGRL